MVRYATRSGVSVVGGASKLLSKFIGLVGDVSIISYADKRISNGNLYKQLGFIEIRSSPPSFFWMRSCERLSRYKTQKHKLKDLLPNYDDSLSAISNMKINGWEQVFDAGCFVYGLNNNES